MTVPKSELCAFNLAQTVVRSGVPFEGIDMALGVLVSDQVTDAELGTCSGKCRKCAAEVIVRATGEASYSITEVGCPAPRAVVIIE